MRTYKNEALLRKLNKNVVFIKFEDVTLPNDLVESIMCDYFGMNIKILLPYCCTTNCIKLIFGFFIVAEDYSSRPQQISFMKSSDDKNEFHKVEDVIKMVNEYVLSRPFQILKWGTGKYKYILLDPNGLNYTGEYVSLTDAKRTCDFNYRQVGE